MANKPVHPIDKMDSVQFVRELVGYFGTRRATELMGWAVLVPMMAWPKSIPEFRKEVEASGFNKSSMYLALLDMRKFGKFIEDREGFVPEKLSTASDGLALLFRLAAVRDACFAIPDAGISYT